MSVEVKKKYTGRDTGHRVPATPCVVLILPSQDPDPFRV
jgi:hypothetical protein